MNALVSMAALVLGQTLTEDNFALLRDQLIPAKADLQWRSLPWHITVWDSLRQARQDGKPVLLYAMNGHPCGHT